MDNLKVQYNNDLNKLMELKNTLQKGNNNESEINSIKAQIISLQEEMKELLEKIGDYTNEEVGNGFKITQPTTLNNNSNNKLSSNNNNSLVSNWKMAVQLSKSTIIPESFRDKPENVIVAIGLAQKMNLDPFTIMQNLNIIKGKTAWSGSFCRTLIERSGKFTGLKLVFTGQKGTDTYGCYMEAKEKETGDIIKGPEVTMKMARAEGWTKNTKWNNMSELMLSYRATAFFARVYTPESLNGVQTAEEIEDVNYVNKKRTYDDILKED